jgi:Holliday junction resolvase
VRHGRRRDANERAIIDALRWAGYKVAQLDGTGTPDLLVRANGVLVLLEVKDPTTGGKVRRSSGALGELTPAQKKWWETWGAIPTIAKSPEEALAAVRQAVAERPAT